MVCVQFGCGLSAPEDWHNYDASQLLRLQKIPILGKFAPSGPFGRFPENVRYGDIVKGLPFRSNTVDLLYCSHVLEHLSLGELRIALENAYAILKTGGVFRLVLPDLETKARNYINSNKINANSEFMRETLLGREERKINLISFLRSWIGGSTHLWMWDYKGLKFELEQAGFESIRRASFGDSKYGEFSQVEDISRWENELGLECRKL